MKFRILLIAVLATISSVSFAQTSANATGSAYAVVLQSISCTYDSEGGGLHFGALTPGASIDGAITIAAGSNVHTVGAGTTASNVTLYDFKTRTAAHFLVTGTSNSKYAVTLPSNNTITITNGSSIMNVNDFTKSTIANLSATGLGDFYVGGTLSVPTTVSTGSYSGTFQVSIQYN